MLNFKKFFAYSRYSTSLDQAGLSRWFIPTIILIFTFGSKIFINRQSLDFLLIFAFSFESSTANMKITNNPKLVQYPITKKEHATYIIFNYLLLGLTIFLVILLLSIIFMIPGFNNFNQIVESVGAINYILDFALKAILSFMAILSLYISLIPTLFISDFKEWLRKAILPFGKHMIFLFLVYNTINNNYTFVLGSSDIYVGKIILSFLVVFWLVVITIQTYSSIYKQL